MSLPPVLEDAPSHFNWNLDSDDTLKEFGPLNLQITEHIQFNPNEMPIQAHLFQSFLYMSKFKHPRPDFSSFEGCLKTAYDKINALTDIDAQIGYKLVAKCNEAIAAHRLKTPDNDTEDEIEDLMKKQTDKSQACIDSVHAFALSRLGPPKYSDTEIYYRQAIELYPDKSDWLYGLALVIRRQAGFDVPTYAFTDEMKKEEELYNRILKLDKNHGMALASLAQLLLRKEGKFSARAKDTAKRAEDSQHDNPYVRSLTGKVYRKRREYDAAFRAFEVCDRMSKDTYFHHQHGLVYRDKYNSQVFFKEKALHKLTNRQHANYEEPDINLLRKALGCFTKAVEGSSTNTMALLDKARAHADLGEIKPADEDFKNLIATDNLLPSNRFTFNYEYAMFLREKHADNKTAAKHLRTAINLAVTYCTTAPVSRENPTPSVFKGIARDFVTASENFQEIMNALTTSTNPEEQAEGLKGLAWLHQALGEHAAAKEKYEEYLKCEGTNNDYKAVEQLIRSLIQLDNLEEARKQIEVLKTLKPELAEPCHIECLLREGEIEQDGKKSKDLFWKAVKVGSMTGCQKLADILEKDPKVATWEFRADCAKILHCCEMNNEKDGQIYSRIKKLVGLEDDNFGTLRKYHLEMELALMNDKQDGKKVLNATSLVVNEARTLLDRTMTEFHHKNFPNILNYRSQIFYIEQDKSKPKDEKDIKKELTDLLYSMYKWKNFKTNFKELLDLLVQIQPAFPGNDNWYIAFNRLNNMGKHGDREQHAVPFTHSRYHVPVLLKGKKVKDDPIPDGSNGPIRNKVPGVDYEVFAVTDVARRATTEMEKIVQEFLKYL
ncbi:uncharacterized protein [Amphiura filiformis]|uniref:uncharacterized protein n=1 Tax=Amphiura filiformis TaxID=82378 RepID=UPI003B20FE68